MYDTKLDKILYISFYLSIINQKYFSSCFIKQNIFSYLFNGETCTIYNNKSHTIVNKSTLINILRIERDVYNITVCVI